MALAERLGVGRGYLIHAYEDPLAYLLKERNLPANVDPLDNKLEDPLERENLRKVFERGLASPPATSFPSSARSRIGGLGMAERRLGAARSSPFSAARRFPRGLALAARHAGLGAERNGRRLYEPDPSAPVGPLIAPGPSGSGGAKTKGALPKERRERLRSGIQKLRYALLGGTPWCERL